MISFTNGSTTFQTLSQNTSSANATLYGTLANIEQRYLLQRYFANEGSYNIQTIGQTSLTLNAAVPINSTSCTLDETWPYQTCYAQLTFSDGEVVNALFTNGSSTVTWLPATTGTLFYTVNSIASGATSAVLQSAWTYPTASLLTSFSDGSTKTVTYTLNSTAISWTGGLAEAVLNTIYTSTIAAASSVSIGGVQFYPFPPNFSKLKDITITVGVLKWTLKEIRTREEWDNLNVFPYYASIPQNYFIYPGGDKGGQIGIWPIPSTTGNVIGFNYKFRVPDLSIADVTTATATATNGSTAITLAVATLAATTNAQLESRWIQIAQPAGDNLWYQIQSVATGGASLTLYQPYQGINVSGAACVVGQMPLIAEDFQDMLVWKALMHYFTSVGANPSKAKEYNDVYNTKLQLLQEYSGSNTTNVNLSRRGRKKNPNSFVYNGIG